MNSPSLLQSCAKLLALSDPNVPVCDALQPVFAPLQVTVMGTSLVRESYHPAGMSPVRMTVFVPINEKEALTISGMSVCRDDLRCSYVSWVASTKHPLSAEKIATASGW